jgi:hypothetical protein
MISCGTATLVRTFSTQRRRRAQRRYVGTTMLTTGLCVRMGHSTDHSCNSVIIGNLARGLRCRKRAGWADAVREDDLAPA